MPEQGAASRMDRVTEADSNFSILETCKDPELGTQFNVCTSQSGAYSAYFMGSTLMCKC